MGVKIFGLIRQSLGAKMKIGLGQSAVDIFKAYRLQDRGFEVKSFSYIYSLFKGKHCIETKITENATYG